MSLYVAFVDNQRRSALAVGNTRPVILLWRNDRNVFSLRRGEEACRQGSPWQASAGHAMAFVAGRIIIDDGALPPICCGRKQKM